MRCFGLGAVTCSPDEPHAGLESDAFTVLLPFIWLLLLDSWFIVFVLVRSLELIAAVPYVISDSCLFRLS